MKTQHTPGPWKHGWESIGNEWAIVTNKAGNIIANVNTESGPDAGSAPATRKMPAEANARLIAAAPELLEALKLTQEAIRGHKLLDVKKRFSLCLADAAISKAIAKAEGGAPCS